MRFLLIFPLILTFFMHFSMPAYAQAENTGKLLFGHKNTNPAQPYLNEAKIPHNNQWDQDNWTPDTWREGGKSDNDIIADLYAAGIVTGQYDDDVPILEVGEAFVRLSAQDQRRVVAFVDDVFNVTGSDGNGVFYVLLEGRYDTVLGIYTRHGLQLQ